MRNSKTMCITVLLASLLIASIAYAENENDMAMEWPVSGNVVMDYSIDRTIYDLTLDQYRTNNSISISAANGDIVKAAADGVVKTIAVTRVYGNTVVIEHGNGWRTTYSQLQDNIFVSVGDAVEKGKEIGRVGSPSAYTSELGSHLVFKVTQDDKPVNPNIVLVQ